MKNLEEFMKNADDVRELKRALAVNMLTKGIEISDIRKGLGVSDSYVGKWKTKYEKEGIEGLRLKYEGNKGYFREESGKPH